MTFDLEIESKHPLWGDFTKHMRGKTSKEISFSNDDFWWWGWWQCFLAGAKAENNRMLEET